MIMAMLNVHENVNVNNDSVRNTIKSKNLYKIFLGLVKYLPLTTLILKILSTALNYFGIASPLLAYLCGTSFPFVVILLLIACIFRFCYLYKMPIYFIFSLDGFIFFCKIFAVESLTIYREFFILSGIFLIIYIIYAYLTRKKNKIDPIKHFCEKYCDL